ncbi:uncharacterized protein LOC125038203 [Penaeus chinensis]|uniref:uncharacterized protein LOC125038203 n=1 Tax=Penaeus chinensis TaxID=139456 RepID=UPI001FB5C860|nr:uncharacterized protein LOC125038203 [Penaeus chinensis]
MVCPRKKQHKLGVILLKQKLVPGLLLVCEHEQLSARCCSSLLYFCSRKMPQDQFIQVPMDNIRYDRDDRYCTTRVVVKLFVLGVLLLAVALAGFLASATYCRVNYENTCLFQARAASSIGVAAISAGGFFIFLALVGHCKRSYEK